MRKLLLALILLLPVHAFAATAFVQSAQGVGFGTTTVDVVFGSDVTSGSVIAFTSFWTSGTGTLDSVVKQSGTASVGSSSFADNPVRDGLGSSTGQGYLVVTGSGSLTLRATYSVSVSAGILVHEISGCNTVSPLDKSAMVLQNPSPGTGTDALTSGAVTTTSNGQYIFGSFFNTFLGAANWTAGTGFTDRETMTNRVFTESRIQTSAGAIAATATWDVAAGYSISSIMTFKAASVVTSNNNLLSLGVGQ